MQLKRVLITAGQVYGPLDGNKLVGNRVRGIWALRFALFLRMKGHSVTLLVPDTQNLDELTGARGDIAVVKHKGYFDYAQKCEVMAPHHDAAVMAAAVVNWIPANPFPGKMPTAGFEEGDIQNIPFVLAPRIINRMKKWNPKLTLIGCKMLIDSKEDELIDAAHHVSLTAHCNAVVANDMGHGLKMKQLVYPDRTVVNYNDAFFPFFKAMMQVIEDEHWRTLPHERYDPPDLDALETFDRIVAKYRARFTPRSSTGVFGSLLVPCKPHQGYLISPREKGTLFTSAEAVWSYGMSAQRRATYVEPGKKATLNAPLLLSVSNTYPGRPILHLHETLEGYPTVPYAPPGTDRDNLREIPGPVFNIEGHGFMACLNDELEIP